LIWVLLTSVSRILFKHSKLGENYSLKKSNNSISNSLNTHVFIKDYYLRPLTSASKTLINISLLNLVNHLYILKESLFSSYLPKSLIEVYAKEIKPK